jgi:hypothetical protein
MKPIKEIEYAPMKVSFRKKMQLRDITEDKWREFRRMAWSGIFALSVAIAMVILFFYTILN